MPQLYREAYESQAAELQAQLTIRALQGGQIAVLELDSLAAIPEALIRARIAAKSYPKRVAKRLG